MRLVLALGIALALAAPRLAHACASCGCGDPTLTTMGAEQPYAGRLRVGAAMLTSNERVFDELGDVQVFDARLTASMSYAMSSRQALSITVPVVWRHAEQGPNEVQAAGLGGVELRWRGLLWRDRALAAHHLLMLQAGIEAPSWFSSASEHVETELWQPEQALFGLAGLSLLEVHGEWSFLASGLVRVPGAGDGAGDGMSVLGTGYIQWQPRTSLALRAAVDSRYGWDWASHTVTISRYEHAIGGVDHVEGLTVLVGPDLVWSPSLDLTLTVGFKVPVAQTGNDSEQSFAALAAATFDL
jgi:hypothetical protein